MSRRRRGLVSRRVRRLGCRVGLPLVAVALAAGCGGPADPATKAVREQAAHAAIGLDARLAPLMRQHEVIADWHADYCVNDPLTVADWDCTATRDIALRVSELRAGAQSVEAELTRLGCHPEGDPSMMGLGVMLDHHPEQEPAHSLPAVQFRCGQDMVYVQPSDRTDPRLALLQRPTAWPEQATGGPQSRLLSGGVVTPQDGDRLRTSDGIFLLITAARPYYSG